MTSSHELPRLYKGGFFFALHYALITYASSTYLEQFLSPQNVGFVFTTGSLLGIVLVYASIRFWRRNAKVLLAFVMPLIILLLILLATLPYAQTASVLFSMYLGLNFLGWYLFDIAIEHESQDSTTGQIRGSYLTFVNVAWLFSPLISGIIITQGGFNSLFFASAGASLLAFFVIARDSRAALSLSRHTLKLNPAVWIEKPEIKKALYINFTLQLFYSAMETRKKSSSSVRASSQYLPSFLRSLAVPASSSPPSYSTARVSEQALLKLLPIATSSNMSGKKIWALSLCIA